MIGTEPRSRDMNPRPASPAALALFRMPARHDAAKRTRPCETREIGRGVHPCADLTLATASGHSLARDRDNDGGIAGWQTLQRLSSVGHLPVLRASSATPRAF